MSRSYRKTPIVGFCAGSDKEFKKDEHRRERRASKVFLETWLDEDKLPSPVSYGNPWASPKDGKMYLSRESIMQYKWGRK